MTLKSTFTAIAAALVLMSAFAPPTAAQLTSASVSGTVKDVQGGVIPGATLALINETLGVQTADVFTNEYGDFVFANIQPGRYIVQVSMDGFKSIRRTGVIVSAGDRLGLGTLTIELGTRLYRPAHTLYDV